jgi:sugar phosphate isomerase/epimerase
MKTPTTRRGFLGAAGLAGLGAAAVNAASGAPAPAEPAPGGIKLGIATYSFRKFDRPKVIEMIQQAHTPWISVKNTPQQLAADSTPEQARQARQAFDAAGLKVMSIGNIDMTKASTAGDLRPLFELAKNFGAPMMVCAPTHANLKAVEQMVREYDIRIAIHNHGPEDRHFPSAQSVLEAVGGLDPRCGLCLDVGHAYRAVRMPRLLKAEAARKGDAAHTSNSEIVGALEDAAAARSGKTVYDDDPVNIIAVAGARLFDMHIKDLTDLTNKDSQCDVGDGQIPIPNIFRELIKIHYQGCVNLEYEINADDPLPGVQRSFRYMRGVLAGLAAA